MPERKTVLALEPPQIGRPSLIVFAFDNHYDILTGCIARTELCFNSCIFEIS